MTLWGYLKTKMLPYKDKIAFAGLGLTYAEILDFDKQYNKNKKTRICAGMTREIHALNILKAIAEGDIVVPISLEYGERTCDYIKKQVEGAEGIDDVAFIMFTSGTTGHPKGVMLTDLNIISNLEYINDYFDVSGCKSICIGRPLVHIAVLTGELLYALCHGLTIYFFEETFIPKRLVNYLDKNLIDIFCGTPTLFYAMAKCQNHMLLSLKIGVVSGEILSIKSNKEISNAFPHTKFYNVYGLTEHSPRVSALLPHEFQIKPNSVGKPIGNVEVKIINDELLIKSHSVMKGYFNDPQKTKEKIIDGWLYTGDCASIDDKGYIYIHGRMDNMIIKSGLNIYPEEIELAVKECKDVEDCVVFTQQTDFGVIICLNYTGKIEPNELRTLLLKQMNPNIVPTKIQKIDVIAKTASGKKVRK